MLLNGNNFNMLGGVAKERNISGLAGPLGLLYSTSYQAGEPGGHREMVGCLYSLTIFAWVLFCTNPS